jgi:hypothetical protein
VKLGEVREKQLEQQDRLERELEVKARNAGTDSQAMIPNYADMTNFQILA